MYADLTFCSSAKDRLPPAVASHFMCMFMDVTAPQRRFLSDGSPTPQGETCPTHCHTSLLIHHNDMEVVGWMGGGGAISIPLHPLSLYWRGRYVSTPLTGRENSKHRRLKMADWYTEVRGRSMSNGPHSWTSDDPFLPTRRGRTSWCVTISRVWVTGNTRPFDPSILYPVIRPPQKHCDNFSEVRTLWIIGTDRL